MLVAIRLLTEDEVLPELNEERLSDLYVRVVELIEGGSRLPRKKATHGLELLRQQGLLSRVDGAGLVRCGAFSLTRLGSAIAEFWIEDESLTRQSLVLLTTALRFKLGELLSDAQAAQVAEHWEQVRQKLRVNVVTLVEGIDRRRRGLDQQQSNIQLRVGALLAANWYSAVETCEGLLDETTETLGELKDILIGETGDLLNLLAEIESLAGAAGADGAADAAREAQLRSTASRRGAAPGTRHGPSTSARYSASSATTCEWIRTAQCRDACRTRSRAGPTSPGRWT